MMKEIVASVTGIAIVGALGVYIYKTVRSEQRMDAAFASMIQRRRNRDDPSQRAGGVKGDSE